MPAYAVAETLHNGIELPDTWPPNHLGLPFEEFQNLPSLRWHAPMPVPYLSQPPAVIGIDVGRQLFVDDFLIENSELRRVWHRATYHSASPVLQPDRPWEQAPPDPSANKGSRAMVFSDGAWFDPREGRFKLWYHAAKGTAYAVSRDGVRWEKPALDVMPGTNIVLPSVYIDSTTVWLDDRDPDPARRFKMWISRPARAPGVPGNNAALDLRVSADGIRWSEPVWTSGPIRDRSTVFHNPFRDVWVYSIKLRPTVRLGERTLAHVRSRAYRETRDVMAPWRTGDIVPWTGADKLDPPRNTGLSGQILEGQHLYNLDAVAYESVLLGLFAIFHDDGRGPGARRHMNDTALGFSRDGFHWDRPDREPFLAVGTRETDWHWTNVQSAGGGCLVVGDKLYFYCSGRSKADARSGEIGFTGLATLRRDGFASMDAGERESVLITRPVTFTGRHLFVNADTSAGELRVSIMPEHIADFHDKNDKVIAPYTAENCVPIRTDSTLQRVGWKGGSDLSTLAGKPVRFRFHLQRGRLYSFWVSPDESGASHGYVGAGGPGFSGGRDTVGIAAYEAARRVISTP